MIISGFAVESEVVPERGMTPQRTSRGDADQTAGGTRDLFPRYVSFRVLLATFSLEVIAMFLWQLPVDLSFSAFAFQHDGTDLQIFRLMQAGYRPLADFGYHYGLLPIAVGWAWFHVAGATPWAAHTFVLAADLLIARALARFASSIRVGPAGIALMICAMTFSISTSYSDVAHALEAVLLSNALAEQAEGRRPAALALAAAALLTKPAMAYVYGLTLLIIGALAIRKRAALADLRPVVPAAIVAAGGVAALALVFGLVPALSALLPFEGMRAYQAMGFGLLRSGRVLFYFPGVRIGYYLGTVSGFYIAGSAALLVSGGLAALRMFNDYRSGDELGRDSEMIFTCAVIHASFLSLMFGTSQSWIYYSYALAMGLAATSASGEPVGRLGWALALLALVGNKSSIVTTYHAWTGTHRYAITGGLWAPPEQAREWARVRDTVRGSRAFMINWGGCWACFAPEFPALRGPWLQRELATPAEADYAAAGISVARFLVVRTNTGFTDWALEFPFVQKAIADSRLLWRGRYFAVYERNPT